MTIGEIINNGIRIGIKNFIPLIINTILWVLTIWIPYLNVGTTIGLIGLITKMGKDEGSISLTEIFNPEYRKNMGEFFLVMTFVYMGVSVATFFMLIPGIVVGIAWGLAVYLVLDQNVDPMQAIKMSNDATYGKKWTIFFAQLLPVLIFCVGSAILVYIGGKIHEYVGAFFSLIVFVGAHLIVPILLGIQAYIYQQLALKKN